MSISKLSSIKDAAEAFNLGFFLKRNSVVNFLLSLLLLVFQGVSFFSLPFNGYELLCGPKQDTHAALCHCAGFCHAISLLLSAISFLFPFASTQSSLAEMITIRK